MTAIELKGLCKTYEYYKKELGFKASLTNLFARQKLYKEAVKDLSFTIDKGSITGFIGPNGAGKTTTLKMLSGILFPTEGEARVLGYTPWERKKAFKKRISIIMSQKGQLWPDLPANECIYLTKCMYEMEESVYKRSLGELSELLDVKDLMNVQVRRLSLGERMKIELINALIHRPEVIFLDEPTIGLDFTTQKRVREFFKEYNRETGSTILLTSHYIQDLEELCDRSIVINNGMKVFDGKLHEINEIFQKKKIFKLSFNAPVDLKTLLPFGEVKSFDPLSVEIEVTKEKSREFMQFITSHLPLHDFSAENYPLEEGISQLYKSEMTHV